MIPCYDTGRGEQEAQSTNVALAHVTSLLWATPRVALPISTECGRTFTVNHLCAYQQMGVRNRWKRRHGYKDKVKNKVNCCRAAASYEGLLHFQGHKEIQVGGLFVLYNVHSTSRK